MRRTLYCLPKALGLLLVPLLVNSPLAQSQTPESDSTDEQLDAIHRVDQLVGRLQAMPWGPEVVNGLARLGDTACRYNQELGVRVFETAYSVAAGLDLDLKEEASLHVLSRLASAALRCHPIFRDRPLAVDAAGDDFESDLSANASLRAALASVATNPNEAAKFALGAASQIHILDRYEQMAFVSALGQLRQQQPVDADEIFQRALLNAALSGTTEDLFTLGNYVFGPKGATADEVAMVALTDDRMVYDFSELRTGISTNTATQYVRIATETIRALSLDSESSALAVQLASWAEKNAPEHAPILDELLNAQLRSHEALMSELHEKLQPSTLADAAITLEAQLASAIDEKTKSRLSFELCAIYIRQKNFRRAEELIENLRRELRRPVRNIIDFKLAIMMIEGDTLDIAAIKVAGLKDSSHKVLAALSLAAAYWERSREDGLGSLEDQDSTARLLQVALSAAEAVPAPLRPEVRISVANILAMCDQLESALHMIEVAMQELNTDRSYEDLDRSVSFITYYGDGGFRTGITDNDQVRYFDLVPPNLRGYNFEKSIATIAMSPDMDLDRLESIMDRSVNENLRIGGLVAVASGVMSRAFRTNIQ